MPLTPPPITHVGTDWTPFIKKYGEMTGYTATLLVDFDLFLEHFKDEPFASEPRSLNAYDFFVMAIRVLRPLTPQQRSVVNDWPTLRKLIDETYFTPEAIREKRKVQRKLTRQLKQKRKQTLASGECPKCGSKELETSFDPPMMKRCPKCGSSWKLPDPRVTKKPAKAPKTEQSPAASNGSPLGKFRKRAKT